MKRKCPNCKTELKDNGYIKDHGINTLSYLELIIKNEDLKKEHYELKASYCPKCGHVELWVDFEQYEKMPHSKVQSKEELDVVVNRLASDYNRRKEEEEKKLKQQQLIDDLKQKAIKQRQQSKKKPKKLKNQVKK